MNAETLQGPELARPPKDAGSRLSFARLDAELAHADRLAAAKTTRPPRPRIATQYIRPAVRPTFLSRVVFQTPARGRTINA